MPRTHEPVVYERILEVVGDWNDPLREVEVRVELTAPSGAVHEIDAYWDGGETWRFRAPLHEAGEWSYRGICRGPEGVGFVGGKHEGKFVAYPAFDGHPARRHGPLQVDETGTHFEHADGTPFFGWRIRPGTGRSRPERTIGSAT